MSKEIEVRGKDGKFFLSKPEEKKLIECEKTIEMFRRSGLEAGKALIAIRDEKLYRQTHKTFEEYLRERWDISQPYSSYLMNSAILLENLKKDNHGYPLPETERQARPLTVLEPREQVKAWKEAVKIAGDNPVTGKIVQQVVFKITHKEEPAKTKEYVEKDESFTYTETIESNVPREIEKQFAIILGHAIAKAGASLSFWNAGTEITIKFNRKGGSKNGD